MSKRKLRAIGVKITRRKSRVRWGTGWKIIPITLVEPIYKEPQR